MAIASTLKMGEVETCSGGASSGVPVKEWPGMSGAIPSSSFGSSAVERGLELRQASIWHRTVATSSKRSLRQLYC